MAKKQSVELAVSHHGQMAEAFELLARGLGPFIDERMSAYFADDLSWEEAAANRMGRAHEHGSADPLFQLLVLRRFWGPVFGGFFGEDLRGLINELVEARNLWAHFNLPDDTDELDHILLAIERLTAPVAPEGTSQLRRIRTRLKQPASGSDRTGTDETENSTAEHAIDSRLLQSQLGETENAFQNLQNDYADIARQLEIARKASAGKQLRLSLLERELQEASGTADALRLHLAEQHGAYVRLNWLFTGFITVMLVLMALLAL